jgi:hypothetical protein
MASGIDHDTGGRYYCEDGGIRFRFKKQRKVERCKMLLRRAEIAFSEHFFGERQRIRYHDPGSRVPLWLRQFAQKRSILVV